MTTEIVTTDERELAGDLAGMDSAALRRELLGAIGITAHAIRRVAVIWHELERRGEDLSDIRFALGRYMRAVAEGRLLPAAVARLAGERRKLDAVASLPPAEQQRLLDGAPVTIVRPDGQVDRTLAEMTFPEVAIAIRDGAIRTVEEQRLAVQRVQARRMKPRKGRRPRVHVDRDRAEIRIGTGPAAPIEDVIAALRAAGMGV